MFFRSKRYDWNFSLNSLLSLLKRKGSKSLRPIKLWKGSTSLCYVKLLFHVEYYIIHHGHLLKHLMFGRNVTVTFSCNVLLLQICQTVFRKSTLDPTAGRWNVFQAYFLQLFVLVYTGTRVTAYIITSSVHLLCFHSCVEYGLIK